MKFIADFFEALQGYINNLLIFFRKDRYLTVVFGETPSPEVRYIQITFSIAILFAITGKDYFKLGFTDSSIRLVLDQLFSGEFLKLVIIWVVIAVLFLKLFADIFGRSDFERKILWNVGFYHIHFMAASLFILFLILRLTKDITGTFFIPGVSGWHIHFIAIIAIPLTCYFFFIPYRYAKRNFKPINTRLILASYTLLVIVYSTLLLAVGDMLGEDHNYGGFALFCYEEKAFPEKMLLRVDTLNLNHFRISSQFILKDNWNKDWVLDPYDSSIYLVVAAPHNKGGYAAFSCRRDPAVLVMKKNDYLDFHIQTFVDSNMLAHITACTCPDSPYIASFFITSLSQLRDRFYSGKINLVLTGDTSPVRHPGMFLGTPPGNR